METQKKEETKPVTDPQPSGPHQMEPVEQPKTEENKPVAPQTDAPKAA